VSTVLLLVGFLVLLMVVTTAAVAVGYLIAETYEIRVEDSISRSQREVFDFLRAIERQADWRSLVSEVTAAEVGPSFRLSYQANPIDADLVLERETPPSELVFRGEEVSGHFRWHWTVTIEPESAQTCRVRIAERGEAKHPWYRFVLKYVSGREKVARDLLDDLARALPMREETS